MSRVPPLAARIAAWPRAPRLLELALLALIVGDFVRVVLRLIALDAPLHWDEAVYAVRARSWVDPDVPLSGWSYIRPPLLPLVSSIGVLAGGDEWQLRVIGLVAGVAVLLLAWWLARSVAGPIAGVGAAAILYLSPTLQEESATLLTDVPAAALLLGVAALLWREMELRRRLGIGVVLAVGVAGLAFLMRYGSILALAPLVAVSLALWWRRLRESPLVTAAAIVVAATLLVGHLAWSVAQTGSPLGIMLGAQAVVSDDPAGLSPWTRFLRYRHFALAGEVGHLAMLAGLVSLPASLIAAWRRPELHRTARAAAFLVLPAVAHVFLLTRGVGHAEERFFLFSTAMLVVAGSCAIAVVLRIVPWPPRVAVVLLLLAALLVTRAPIVDHSFRRTVETARYYDTFEVVGRAVAEAAGPDCGIVGAGDPILAWYSRCETERLRLQPDGGSPARALVADDRWAVIFGTYDDLELETPIARSVTDHASGAPLRILHPVTGEEIAVAWRLETP